MNPLQYYRALIIWNGAVPLVMLAWDASQGALEPNSVNYALHVTGILSMVFLFLSLLMTPLRWITGWGGWIAFRRALGLYGFWYSVLHAAIYVLFDRELNVSSTISEISTRRYLQVGFVAVLLMIPLAITSTNGMIRQLGVKRWRLLHRTSYLVAGLGVLHYFLLVKSDVGQPLAFAAVLTVLLGTRLVPHGNERQQTSIRNTPLPKS
jgi:DMSO/TMAO reductase YedYZ heme-binding membrane subunit